MSLTHFELATLSHIFTKAVDWKWLDHLPCRPKKLDEPEGRIFALSADECEALMAEAVASGDADLWFVAVALNTGMRHSEILAARWDQLDLDRRRLFVSVAKAGQRSQPLTEELVNILPASARCGTIARAGSFHRRIATA